MLYLDDAEDVLEQRVLRGGRVEEEALDGLLGLLRRPSLDERLANRNLGKIIWYLGHMSYFTFPFDRSEESDLSERRVDPINGTFLLTSFIRSMWSGWTADIYLIT